MATNKPYIFRKRCVLISTPFPRLEDGFIDGVPAICRIVELHGTVNVKYWVQFHQGAVGDVQFFDIIREIYPGIDIQRVASNVDLFSREIFESLDTIHNGVWVHENLAFASVVSRFTDDNELLESGAIFFGSSNIEYKDEIYRSSFSYISSEALSDVDSIYEAIERIKLRSWCDSFKYPTFERPTARSPIVYNANGGTICWFNKKGDFEKFEDRFKQYNTIFNFNKTFEGGRYTIASGIELSRFVDGYDTSNIFELLSWLSTNFWSSTFNGNVNKNSFTAIIDTMVESLYENEGVRSVVGTRINGVKIPSKVSLKVLFHECLDLIPKGYYGDVSNLGNIDHVFRWRDSFAVIHDPLFEPWKFQQPMLEFCYVKYALLFNGRKFEQVDSTISVDVSYDVMTFLRDINRDELLQGYGKHREAFYDGIVFLRNASDMSEPQRLFLLSDSCRKLNQIKFAL